MKNTGMSKELKNFIDWLGGMPQTSTPEDLDCEKGFRTLTYGDKVICWADTHLGSYAATYRFTGKGRNCDDECKLLAICNDFFEDGGHAVEWAMRV